MLMYTIKVQRDDLDWLIEEHEDGEIRITCAEMCAARVQVGPGGILGPIEPEPEWAEPPERMELLRQDVVDALREEGLAGRGPWANVEVG